MYECVCVCVYVFMWVYDGRGKEGRGNIEINRVKQKNRERDREYNIHVHREEMTRWWESEKKNGKKRKRGEKEFNIQNKKNEEMNQKISKWLIEQKK